MAEMGFKISGFAQDNYEFVATSLKRNNLPESKLRALYKHFCKLAGHKINDHLIIFLNGSERIRKDVAKHFPNQGNLSALAERPILISN